MSQEAAIAMDKDPLAFLVDPEDTATFLSKHWERSPVLVKATPQRREFFEGLASFDELARLANICEEEGGPLEFGLDVNAARYVHGRRETPNGEIADCATLERLYHKEGCTMQFHQPQRFSEDVWRLLAALERQLGCLVGCNAYITPAGTQGLAPHWDDVEIFVVQTQGSKRWRLYGPPPAPRGAAPGSRAAALAACNLANQVSGDLAEDEIGEPMMEVTLEVGDVLYMPRGTIHQAVAQDGASAHLTVSTYQRWSCADALQYAVSVALANASLQTLLPAPLKAGLPLGFLSAAALGPAAAAQLAANAGGFGEEGTAAMAAAAAATAGSNRGAGGGAATVARQLAAACRALADCLEGEGEGGLGPRLVATAADAMSEDFMRSRLPPHPAQLPERGPAPTLQDSVQCVGAGLFRLVPFSTKDEGGCAPDCDEDHDHDHHHEHGPSCGAGCQEEEHEHEHEHGEGGAAAPGFAAPPALVRLISCLQNDRTAHMMGGGEDEDEEGGSSGSESDSEDGGSDDGADVAELAARAAAALAAAPGSRKRKQPAAGGEDNGSGSEGEFDDDEEEEEEEEEDEEAPEDLVFPAEFAPALVQLLGTAPDGPAGGGQPVAVAAIALPDPELQVQVAAALWDAGVLRTVKAAKQQKAKQKAKKEAAAKTAGKKQQQQQQPGSKQGKPAKQQDGGGKGSKKGAASKAKKQKA